MKGLTRRQAEALGVINELTVDGVAPTYREIGAKLGLSSGNVHDLVMRLEERGAISSLPSKSRSIAVTKVFGLSRYSDAAILSEVKRRGL